MKEETFGISARWLPGAEPGDGDDAARATFGWLRLSVGEQSLTHFRTDHGQEGDEVQVPLYHIAEWIALNWWSLLYEPKKTDNAEQDFDFRSRHWLGVTRNGFALPDTWIIPAGGRVEINSFARHLAATRLQFTESVHAAVDASQVRQALTAFVGHVVDRLETAKEHTLLEQVWSAIRATSANSEEFCRLVGSLGLSPYDEHPEIEALLDHLSETLNPNLLRDLCEAASSATLSRVAKIATRVWRELPKAPEADLSKLPDCPEKFYK